MSLRWAGGGTSTIYACSSIQRYIRYLRWMSRPYVLTLSVCGGIAYCIPLSSDAKACDKGLSYCIPLCSDTQACARGIVYCIPLSVDAKACERGVVCCIPLTPSYKACGAIFSVCIPTEWGEEAWSEAFSMCILRPLPVTLVLPSHRLSCRFLGPFHVLPSVLLQGSVVPMRLPRVHPVSTRRPHQTKYKTARAFVCFFC